MLHGNDNGIGCSALQHARMLVYPCTQGTALLVISSGDRKPPIRQYVECMVTVRFTFVRLCSLDVEHGLPSVEVR